MVGQSFSRTSLNLILIRFLLVRLRLFVLAGMSEMLSFFFIAPHGMAYDVDLVTGVFNFDHLCWCVPGVYYKVTVNVL